ncbi:4'-phosphopantetheinyl transferase [uncultured Corynebacterium sp.]|uniref:4'-phosphopantetheinyl transferase family protein n=1 Tax=uncultured Corynebacterium sp. TaxID=159447 RepID=UPI00262A5E2C|nr:4'-phosphopantetheinyl transferase superfamily protein [uncultured Corynebacterium sp.]
MLPAHSSFRQLWTHGNDLGNYNSLDPAERNLVAGAVDSRKAEFGDARWCAHRAIEELTGKPSAKPILRGERGMPIWPNQITGSMTHTNGFRAAVVAPRLLVRSIGVDAEIAQPLPEGVLASIASERELSRMGETGLACADRLLFCAKEATYKAWFPLTGRWLGFEDADIDLRADGTFISYILVRPTPVHFIEGHWTVENGYVIATAIVR